MGTKNQQEEKISFKDVDTKTDRHITLSFLISVMLIGAIVLVYQVYQKNNPVSDNSGADKGNGTQLGQSLQDELANQSQLKKFSNYKDIQAFVEKNSNNQDYGTLGGRKEMMINGSAPSATTGMGSPVMDKATDFTLPSNGSSPDYSQTNIQVAGVDESDIVKTDGEYVYAVSDKTLSITKAYPADEAAVVAKIEFKSQPQEMYLSDNRLVIFGSDQQISTMDYYQQFRRHSDYTFFKVFDVTDKKNPKLVRDLDFEGSYLNSRMVDGYVYFLTSTYAQYYSDEMPVPRILDGGKELYDTKNSTTCQNCPDVYYFDMPYDSLNMVNVATVNIADENQAPKNQVYLLNQGQNFYASKNNLYLTYTKYVSEYQLFVEIARDVIFPLLSPEDQDKVKKIEAVDATILSDQEKLQKIGFIVTRYLESQSLDDGKKLEKEILDKTKEKYTDISKELEKTVVHKIAIDKGNLEYKTYGEVTGTVLNQFSMDESDTGDFRIATTKNQTFAYPYYFGLLADQSMASDVQGLQQDSYSNLYVLDADLKVKGQVENLAPGERIYSVRFMQNRAYMVTFKQVDPLFVVDLKDPKNPTVLGKLKVPGFSSYLHPYDDNTLIGIGKQTAENDFGGVTTKGIKLSLFDVSDVNNPREIDTYEMGGSGSDSLALNDHKAFLFSKEKNLLAIPVRLEDYQKSPINAEQFNGVAVFDISPSGFKLKGKISHDEDNAVPNNRTPYGFDVKRCLYIGDNLYTVSDQFLKINKLENLDPLKMIPFQANADFRIVN